MFSLFYVDLRPYVGELTRKQKQPIPNNSHNGSAPKVNNDVENLWRHIQKTIYKWFSTSNCWFILGYIIYLMVYVNIYIYIYIYIYRFATHSASDSSFMLVVQFAFPWWPTIMRMNAPFCLSWHELRVYLKQLSLMNKMKILNRPCLNIYGLQCLTLDHVLFTT